MMDRDDNAFSHKLAEQVPLFLMQMNISLTDKQLSALFGILRGLSDHELAAAEKIKETTLNDRLKSIFPKFKVRSRAHIQALFIKFLMTGDTQSTLREFSIQNDWRLRTYLDSIFASECPRVRQVFALIAKGYSDKQIAREIKVSDGSKNIELTTVRDLIDKVLSASHSHSRTKVLARFIAYLIENL